MCANKQLVCPWARLQELSSLSSIQSPAFSVTTTYNLHFRTKRIEEYVFPRYVLTDLILLHNFNSPKRLVDILSIHTLFVIPSGCPSSVLFCSFLSFFHEKGKFIPITDTLSRLQYAFVQFLLSVNTIFTFMNLAETFAKQHILHFLEYQILNLYILNLQCWM